MKKINIGKINANDYHTREANKTLRTNLEFCGSDIKTILFTSCTQNEGKSSVAMNIALSIAENGKKVVFVDVDLRKSVLVGRYKMEGVELGVSHYLSGQCELEDALYETNVENLHAVICSKYPPNPSELLSHERFESMIRQLREVYDYVIIDTPPLGLVIDSAIIAKVCDGAVLVLESNKTKYGFAQDVLKQLERSKCPVLGAVLNKVPVHKKGYYGKYGRYGKYYQAYESDGLLTS